jgi:dolichol-phosphate mannosyltransferase
LAKPVKKLVIIPTYNEIENIDGIIRAVMQLQAGFDVLVIDDGSPDGTAGRVEALMPAYNGNLYLEKRSGKLGLGTAYIHGFKWALERGYDYICEMDADFSHNPADLPRLVEACVQGADVAVGSRYVPGGRIENWPLDRHVYSRGGSLYTRLITWIPVKDATAGFVCYTRKVLDAINFDEIKFVGYAFQIEMKFAAWKLGFSIVEIPIVFVDRRVGASKMNHGIIKEGVIGVIRIQWNSLFKNYRKKVKSNNGKVSIL